MAFIRTSSDGSQLLVYHGLSAPTCCVMLHGSATIAAGMISVDVSLDPEIMALASNVSFQLTPVGLPRLASIAVSDSTLTIQGNSGEYHWCAVVDIPCESNCALCSVTQGATSISRDSVLVGSTGGTQCLSLRPPVDDTPLPERVIQQVPPEE